MARLSAIERRAAIVEAAMPLFAERGFEAVTTRAVAEAAGISEALLYRHFASKSALHDAVLASCTMQIDDNMRRIEALPENTGTLVLGVYLMMRSIQMTPMRSGGQIIPRLILRSLLGDGNFARNFIAFAQSYWVKKIERCIKTGIEAGDIRSTFEKALTGFWCCNHLSVGVMVLQLPEELVLQHPISAGEELFVYSVRFALRGIGLTEEAIDRHFQPELFALLLESKP